MYKQQQEFDLKADGDVLIEHHKNGIYVNATFDVRDVLDSIDTKEIYDWKGEEILSLYSKDELEVFIEENF